MAEEPESRGLRRRHDSRRPLAIAAHCGADRISTGTLSAFWSPPTWLRAAFTCRTSRTSSTTTCPKWRKISSTASGRTGRAGGHGVASTLFVKEQRSELFQLERTLGIKIERMRADDTSSLPVKQDRLPVNLPLVESVQKSARFVLPGEVFQAPLEN